MELTGAVIDLFGAPVRQSWGPLGASSGHFRSLGSSWGFLGLCWGLLDRQGGCLGAVLVPSSGIFTTTSVPPEALWPAWGPLGAALGCLWALLGPLRPSWQLSWSLCGRSWKALGHFGLTRGQEYESPTKSKKHLRTTFAACLFSGSAQALRGALSNRCGVLFEPA
eukprot:1356693-Pyramimonas_sp.AAC.1